MTAAARYARLSRTVWNGPDAGAIHRNKQLSYDRTYHCY